MQNTEVIKDSIKSVEKTISGANGEIANHSRAHLERTAFLNKFRKYTKLTWS